MFDFTNVNKECLPMNSYSGNAIFGPDLYLSLLFVFKNFVRICLFFSSSSFYYIKLVCTSGRTISLFTVKIIKNNLKSPTAICFRNIIHCDDLFAERTGLGKE